MAARAAWLPADERREATVETVIGLAATQNPADITTQAIARAMGVTQGALFRHFPTKEAIFGAAMEWVGDRLLARVDATIAATPGVPDALEATFMTHIAFIAAHPGAPRMLFGELQRAAETMPKRVARALLARYAERLGALIARGKASGELPADLDAGAAVTLFIGTIQGLVAQALLAGDIGRLRAEAPRAFALYRRAIGAPSREAVP